MPLPARRGGWKPWFLGRRADQLSDLMAVLKLRAIDLDHSARVADQALCRRLYQARLPPNPSVPETEVSNRPSRTAHPRFGLRNDRRLPASGLLNDIETHRRW